jgi:hypothetical protein
MPNQFTTSIWGDEGFSAILSMKSLPEIIKIIANDTSPPLWNIWEWVFFNVFGTDEIVIRSLALIFFLGTIFFIYKIGGFLWNKKTGFIAATLTFLNPFFFTYAFEGRMYSILALGVTASMYFFLKINYAKKITKQDKAGYVLSTLWALYSHHFSIFILFVQGAWFLWEFIFSNKKRTKILFKLFIITGILYLPWVYPLYLQTSKVGSGFWLGTPGVNEFFEINKKYLGAGIKHTFSNYAFYLTLVLLLIKRWHKDIKKNLILISWFIGPILLTWIVSQFFQSIFFDRYLLYAIPGAMLVVANNRRKIFWPVFSFLVALLLIIDWHYFTHPVKRDFIGLSNYVKQTRQAGDFLINWNSDSHHLWETKYYGIPAPIYIPGGGELPYFVGTALMEDADIISEIPDKAQRVGVVTSGNIDDVKIDGYTKSTVKIFEPVGDGPDIKFTWLTKD